MKKHIANAPHDLKDIAVPFYIYYERDLDVDDAISLFLFGSHMRNVVSLLIRDQESV